MAARRYDGHYDVLLRFWSKVDQGGRDDCWEWKGAMYRDGYGAFGIRAAKGKPRNHRAHRIALMLATKEDAPDGLFALHHCDNRKCCNPRHLYWGDKKQNAADMDKRGRANRPSQPGESAWNSKLTEQNVRDIRASYPGKTQQALADEYGVSQPVISAIVRRVRWTHVE